MTAIPKNLSVDSRKSIKKDLKVGSALPFGPRMFYQTNENIVRMKDIGVGRRIIVIGVLGSFTPDCWNRHLYLVLKYYEYYQERGVNHFCCISTNDPFAQFAWGTYLGCSDKILMWSDPMAKYTNALGMDLIIPWLNVKVRSKRYVILADDMIVTKMIIAENDSSTFKWDCDHVLYKENKDDDEDISELDNI